MEIKLHIMPRRLNSMETLEWMRILPDDPDDDADYGDDEWEKSERKAKKKTQRPAISISTAHFVSLTLFSFTFSLSSCFLNLPPLNLPPSGSKGDRETDAEVGDERWSYLFSFTFFPSSVLVWLRSRTTYIRDERTRCWCLLDAIKCGIFLFVFSLREVMEFGKASNLTSIYFNQIVLISSSILLQICSTVYENVNHF